MYPKSYKRDPKVSKSDPRMTPKCPKVPRLTQSLIFLASSWPSWPFKILRKNVFNLLMGPFGSDRSRYVGDEFVILGLHAVIQGFTCCETIRSEAKFVFDPKWHGQNASADASANASASANVNESEKGSASANASANASVTKHLTSTRSQWNPPMRVASHRVDVTRKILKKADKANPWWNPPMRVACATMHIMPAIWRLCPECKSFTSSFTFFPIICKSRSLEASKPWSLAASRCLGGNREAKSILGTLTFYQGTQYCILGTQESILDTLNLILSPLATHVPPPRL